MGCWESNNDECRFVCKACVKKLCGGGDEEKEEVTSNIKKVSAKHRQEHPLIRILYRPRPGGEY